MEPQVVRRPSQVDLFLLRQRSSHQAKEGSQEALTAPSRCIDILESSIVVVERYEQGQPPPEN